MLLMAMENRDCLIQGGTQKNSGLFGFATLWVRVMKMQRIKKPYEEKIRKSQKDTKEAGLTRSVNNASHGVIEDFFTSHTIAYCGKRIL